MAVKPTGYLGDNGMEGAPLEKRNRGGTPKGSASIVRQKSLDIWFAAMTGVFLDLKPFIIKDQLDALH